MPKFDLHRPLQRDKLVREYGLIGQRLLPWDGYSMPFAGGWCVVEPHTETQAHTQIDQEIFIAVKGSAEVVIGDQRLPFRFGDIVALPKHTNHYVINESNEEFHFYVVWWDEHYAGRFMAELNAKTGCIE